ncbi:ABC transporter permease [Anaerocolumna xylanovorans]|uniref:Putative aldouronate transport system permease protein n=1 Tax=Anaerocolumna xylanovorans DSM 12503 TaxID=1121345 RepID=A0A1M7Y554_9FIRM|nr:ABC transporter permease subunit [Anaerocolumna xylanovorans]SHO47568.1 putative aldouronate transport system permease protein [Anaerocolumna xylanovorans DSM 12503]
MSKDNKRKNKRYYAYAIKKSVPLYIMILPAVVILFCFTYIPMSGIIIAFKEYSPAKGILDSPWVGFKHFIRFFKSYQFGNTLKNTLSISIYSILVGFPLPIVLALLCTQIKQGFFKKFFQVTTYLPHFISTMIMCGMILLFLSPSNGVISHILSFFHMQMPNIIGEPGKFSSIYVWSDVWQNVGWDSIIYLAALSAIDPTYYEAAIMDGASKWQRIKNIDIPLILPTAMILLILRSGSVLSVGFEKVFLLQNQLNMTASEVISTYVYKLGLLNAQYSLSTAINLFNTVINLVVLLSVNQISKKLTDNSLL